MDKLIIPIKSDSERKFWELLKNNSKLRLSELSKAIGKCSLYRIFKKIEELEKTTNISILKKEIRLQENRPVYFYEKAVQIYLKGDSSLLIVS